MLGKPLGIIMISVAIAHAANAGKMTSSPERKVIGTAAEIDIRPDLNASRPAANGKRVWSQSITRPGASFLKAHFSHVNLRKGDRLTLINQRGRVIEHITERGPKQRGNFWALSGQGDNLALVFEFSRDYDRPPFIVDKVIIGNDAMLARPAESGSRSICSPADFEDAICYAGDTGKWDNARASVGVMSVGDNAATAMYCSGVNISGNNTILTNAHCVSNQASCDDTEYVFDAYNTQCGVAAPLSDWTSYRCDQVLASEPFIDCEAQAGSLDFALTSVLGDPAAVHGYVKVERDPIASGEDVYIPQHADGRAQEITVGGGDDVVVDGPMLRYYNTLDTEPGSSGSGIFRTADDKLIGLHHCGGCNTPDLGNRGLRFSTIFPLIRDFTCVAGAADLVTIDANAPNEVLGNGNAIIDPGEQWSFTVNVLNDSCDTAATGATATLSVSAGNATLLTPTVALDDIPPDNRGTSAPITFSVPTDATCGDVISFGVDQITTDGGAGEGLGNVLTVATGVREPVIIAAENFNNGLILWTIENGGTGIGAAATWTTANPGNRSLDLVAPYAIVDSDEHGSQAMDEGLISPPYDVTGYDSVVLEFVHVFNHYTQNQAERGDVEIRSGATASQWVTLASYLGEDASGAVSLDITPYAANDVQVRFRYYNANFEWYWAVDDVTVVGISSPGSCMVFGGADTDGDGVVDGSDNCTLEANSAQVDADSDGFGNACDADLNNDGIVNVQDLGQLRSVFFSADTVADFNGDGVVNVADLGIMRTQFFGPPGPSGVAP